MPLLSLMFDLLDWGFVENSRKLLGFLIGV